MGDSEARTRLGEKVIALALAAIMLMPNGLYAMGRSDVAESPADREPVVTPTDTPPADREPIVNAEIVVTEESDSIPPTEVRADDYAFDEQGRIPFNPSPTRAVWMSALCPGLGQIYNRRYWKLPIVVGGFMGLGYATNWNGNQYTDYLQAYRDLMDSDPGTQSYMNFFPPTVKETDLDRSWLERVFKQKKDYFRRNRDLCIICLVALYLVCMVDAYVDASMAHFDVSPDLSLDLAPAVIVNDRYPSLKRTAFGLQWSLTF